MDHTFYTFPTLIEKHTSMLKSPFLQYPEIIFFAQVTPHRPGKLPESRIPNPEPRVYWNISFTF